MGYKNILLVDDDTDDHEIFTAVLNSISELLHCTALTDANVALKKLESREITPDIIFLDLNMPRMSGEQFLTEIKSRKALLHIPVIILSTSANPEVIELMRHLGAANFITKPDSFDKFVKALQSVL